jgi:hypothetical protein
MDWKGNLDWLKGHFAASPFKNVVPFLLLAITVVEVCAALLCVAGLFQFVASGGATLAYYGAVLCCAALLMLLLGQRVARDYDGARTIAIYFVPAIFLVYLLAT